MQYLSILKFVPEIIELIKWIAEQTRNAIEEKVIREKLKEVTRSLQDTNRQEAARRLNDIIRGDR